MNVSYGLTHNERTIDDNKTYEADTFSLYSKLVIYPDLTASLSSSYTESDTLVLDNESDESFFVNNKSFTTRLDIVAKLYRSLTAFVTANQSNSKNEIRGRSQSSDTTFRVSYRPSDILALQSSYTMHFGDDDRTDSLASSIELYLLRTYKSRLSFFANHIQADDTVDNFRVIGSWDISDYLSLSTNGNYSMGETDNYTLNINLAMRL